MAKGSGKERGGKSIGRAAAFICKAYICFWDTLSLFKSVAAHKSAKYAD